MTLAATVEWGMCARSETNGCPVAVVISVVVVCVVARCVGQTLRGHLDERIVVPHLKRLGTLLCTCANVRATGSGIRGNLVYTFGPTSKTGTFRVGLNTANVSQRVLWSTQRPRLHNQTPTPLACDTACVLVLLICGATFDEPNQRQCRQ